MLVMNFLTGLCLCLLSYVLCDENDVVKNFTGRKGDNCTFQPDIDRRFDSVVAWSFTTFDNKAIGIAQLYKNKKTIAPTDQFGNRLHLNAQTGSLTIRDITFRDSGFYEFRTILMGMLVSVKKFYLFVYDDVGTPVVKATVSQHHHSSTQLNTSCSVDCTVENGREVTLGWYRDNVMLSQTRSPDLNMTLRIPLDVEHHDNSIFNCVASNPVSSHTVLLNITAICSPSDSLGSTRSYYFQIGWVPIVMLCCVACAVMLRLKSIPKINTFSEADPLYIDVNYKSTKGKVKEVRYEGPLYTKVKYMLSSRKSLTS